MENICACVLVPWPWPRAFLSLASRRSVLRKAVLGLGFCLCPWSWPWPPTLCPRLHLCFRNINENHFTGLTLLDLQKELDTVSHDILLAKLEHYGIRGPARSLMQSFLNCQQFVCINGTNSTIKAIPYGVAQGSTLGPLLFLLYCTMNFPMLSPVHQDCSPTISA